MNPKTCGCYWYIKETKCGREDGDFELPYIERSEITVRCDLHEEEFKKLKVEKQELKEKIFKKYKQDLDSHISLLKTIETLRFVPIKDATSKFIKDVNSSKSYKEILDILRKLDFLKVHKKSNKWMCSKEILDVIDFSLIDNPFLFVVLPRRRYSPLVPETLE